MYIYNQCRFVLGVCAFKNIGQGLLSVKNKRGKKELSSLLGYQSFMQIQYFYFNICDLNAQMTAQIHEIL